MAFWHGKGLASLGNSSSNGRNSNTYGNININSNENHTNSNGVPINYFYGHVQELTTIGVPPWHGKAPLEM